MSRTSNANSDAGQAAVKSGDTLVQTGVFESLAESSRLQRLIARVGLLAGRQMATVVRDDHIYLLLLAALVGVVSGLAAGLLLQWIEVANDFFPHPSSGPWYWLVAAFVPALGGLMVGGLRWVIERRGEPIHEGVPAVVEAVVYKNGYLRGRDAALVGMGTGMSIGSGGAVGHEGPVVFIGAAMGSVVARFFGLRRRRQVVMVGAGCAAGLAAAFNAPLAGVIFTIEVVFGRSAGGNVGTMSVFAPLIVAAVTGTFVSHAVFGAHSEFNAVGPGLNSIAEMVPYMILAAVCGLLGPLLSTALMVSNRAFERLRLPKVLRPALGGLAVGLLAALFTRHVLFSGRDMVHAAMDGSTPWWAAGLTAVLKIAATALTLGSGGMGGFFMPSLGIGAALGAFVHGAVAQPLLGMSASAGAAYALVGMGGFLGAVLRAPLTPIVMIFELTHNYGLILPLMTTCILSSFVASRVQADSVFQLALKKRGVIEAPQDAEREVMKRGRVAEVMRTSGSVVQADCKLQDVQAKMQGDRELAWIVVDEAQHPVGMIDARQLAAGFLGQSFGPESTMRDICERENIHLMQAGDSLAGALWAFSTSGHALLPVVDHNKAVIGTIHRADVLEHYSSEVLGRQEESIHVHAEAQSMAQEVGLGVGVILERLVVGHTWAGKTLAQLDLRGRVHVQVIEWVRGHQTLVIDPHRPLAEADVLAVAGSREAILRLRWLI